MKYLFFLKRFEIWLLLGVVVALLIFAFQPVEEPIRGDSPGADGEAILEVSGIRAEETEKPEPKQISVREVTVEPSGGGQIVEVTLLARGKSADSVAVNEETLLASTGNGIPIPHFFAPFQEEQSVAPDEESLVTVKFWLAESTDVIWLDFQGERAEAELPGES